MVKLRILVLHGSRQSAEISAKRLKTLIKKAKDVAEFIFIDGPHLLENERCWWLPGGSIRERDAVCIHDKPPFRSRQGSTTSTVA